MFHFYAPWKFQKQPSEVFYKNSQGLFFNKVLGLSQQLYQIETLTQVFPSELCKIFKNFFLLNTSGQNASKASENLWFSDLFRRHRIEHWHDMELAGNELNLKKWFAWSPQEIACLQFFNLYDHIPWCH